jgi:hypothetical protein
MLLSKKCAEHKHGSMKSIFPSLKMWFGPKKDYFPIVGQLIEAVAYEDSNLHVFYIDKGDVNNCIKFHSLETQNRFNVFNPAGISFSFIYNNKEPYLTFAKQAEEYYSQMKIFEYPVSISKFQSLGDFHMAEARNKSLASSEHDLVFILDVDVRISQDILKNLVREFINTSHDGVFNLKNSHETGNGLYLGKKSVLMKNGFCEKFKYFWYEDTEFLMNFSKIGLLPIVFFRDFDIISHNRNITSPYWKYNQELFKKLALNGREHVA